jgi:hypothetical protein
MVSERRRHTLKRRAIFIAVLLFVATIIPRAGTVTVFGPQTLTRTTGKPNVFDFTFNVINPSLPYTLEINIAEADRERHGDDDDKERPDRDGKDRRDSDDKDRRDRDEKDRRGDDDKDRGDAANSRRDGDNGDRRGGDGEKRGGDNDEKERDDDQEGIASAIVTLNAQDVVRPSDFNPRITLIQRSVTLLASNVLRVELRGKPGSQLTVRIFGTDNEPPTITATSTPSANAAGWNHTDVQVTFACADAGSGLASCSPFRLVTTERQGQIVVGTAVDNAGNTATTSVTLNIDKAPPIVTATQSPDPNANGWNSGPVVVRFAATDALSGVALGSVSVTVTLSTDGANQSATGVANDIAGNVGSATRTGINIDQTKPTITVAFSPASNANGWNNSPVTAHFTCTDTGSGIATCPSDQVIATNGANQTVTGTAIDKAGNATSIVSGAFNIDQVEPTIGVSLTPPPNANDWNNGPVTAHFTCGDALSGVAACHKMPM